jgi:hypothetical protein
LRPSQGLAVADTARACRVDALTVGDFIDYGGSYGEVIQIRGPHGPAGNPPSTDWYTLRVKFEGDGFASTLGPLRASDTVENWS